jgi:hypothetical protein
MNPMPLQVMAEVILSTKKRARMMRDPKQYKELWELSNRSVSVSRNKLK